MCITIDEMVSLIQEWMGDATSPVELAKVYAAITQEANRQLETVMAGFMWKRSEAMEGNK